MAISAQTSREQNQRHRIPAQPPALPGCPQCGTDAYLEFTRYVPASYAPDPENLRPPAVSYICKRCGNHYSHRTPDDWAPPGWQWYA
ncbi:hypothetical protein GCM10023346_40800 [Arthrobacter gyeryongensis]|uniref:Uncharacterized protein n=1 Tax=Arthrobacter gyeryongensis TaxID=1650592 RepID=A0ABP9SRP9_9MICC